MDNPLAGSHPLHAAVVQQAFVAGTVAVTHAAGDHVGDGFKSAMRMIGETSDVIVWIIAAKGVEHQEGIEATL